MLPLPLPPSLDLSGWSGIVDGWMWFSGAHAHAYTTLPRRQRRRRRRRRRAHVRVVATEAWYKTAAVERHGEGRDQQPHSVVSSIREPANGNDRGVCPLFGCVIRASLRGAAPAVTGVAPANRRSDKSSDGRCSLRPASRGGLDFGDGTSSLARSLASTSPPLLFTTIE